MGKPKPGMTGLGEVDTRKACCACVVIPLPDMQDAQAFGT